MQVFLFFIAKGVFFNRFFLQAYLHLQQTVRKAVCCEPPG